MFITDNNGNLLEENKKDYVEYNNIIFAKKEELITIFEKDKSTDEMVQKQKKTNNYSFIKQTKKNTLPIMLKKEHRAISTTLKEHDKIAQELKQAGAKFTTQHMNKMKSFLSFSKFLEGYFEPLQMDHNVRHMTTTLSTIHSALIPYDSFVFLTYNEGLDLKHQGLIDKYKICHDYYNDLYHSTWKYLKAPFAEASIMSSINNVEYRNLDEADEVLNEQLLTIQVEEIEEANKIKKAEEKLKIEEAEEKLKTEEAEKKRIAQAKADEIKKQNLINSQQGQDRGNTNNTSGYINDQNNTTTNNNQSKYSFIEKAGIGVFTFTLTIIGLFVIKKIFDYYKKEQLKTIKNKQNNKMI